MYFWRLVGEVVGKADIIIVVGDARMPELSRNPKLEEIIAREQRNAEQQKAVVHVFNRADLLSETSLKALKKQFPDAFFVSATRNQGVRELRRHLHILGKRMKRDSPRIGVVGYPNVGKSALINALAYSAKAQVADKPGTTRGIQWVVAGSLRILDSPGVIPLEDREDRLALIGAKRADKLKNPEKLASQIIEELSADAGKALQERYGISAEEAAQEPDEILLAIGKKRGILSKGGIVDETKTALMIIREWQKGLLKR